MSFVPKGNPFRDTLRGCLIVIFSVLNADVQLHLTKGGGGVRMKASSLYRVSIEGTGVVS